MQMYRSVVRPLLFSLPPEAEPLPGEIRSRLPDAAFVQLRDASDHAIPLSNAGLRAWNSQTRLVSPRASTRIAIFSKRCLALASAFITVGTIMPQARGRVMRGQDSCGIPKRNRLPIPWACRAKDGSTALRGCARYRRRKCPIFANVGGFNAEEIAETCEGVAPYVDGIEISLICPNVEKVGHVRRSAPVLSDVLDRVRGKAGITVRIPNDTTKDAGRLRTLVEFCIEKGVAGVKVGGGGPIIEPRLGSGAGTLHGRAIFERALQNVRNVAEISGGRIDIKGNGGISSAEDVLAMREAGATCVDLYSAFIYQGWNVARQLNAELLRLSQSVSCKSASAPHPNLNPHIMTGLNQMRVVALEEHFIVPELTKRIEPALIRQRGFPQPGTPAAAHLPVAGTCGSWVRIGWRAWMPTGFRFRFSRYRDREPIFSTARQAPQLARAFNDRLAQVIAEHPERYAGFAHLPMTAPEAAADELERTVSELGFKGAVVNGTTEGRFLDDPSFHPILARAEALDVPIYIHPHLPPRSVFDAYYSGLPGNTGTMLSMAGWGWHSETAIHVLRLVLAGTLERHRKLKLIIGHMGEGLPAMLQRCDDVFGRLAESTSARSISRTILDQVWITTSGFFSLPPFMAALLTFGADRILFSVDYPFSANELGRDFLDRLSVSPDDKAKIAHGNADALLKL